MAKKRKLDSAQQPSVEEPTKAEEFEDGEEYTEEEVEEYEEVELEEACDNEYDDVEEEEEEEDHNQLPNHPTPNNPSSTTPTSSAPILNPTVDDNDNDNEPISILLEHFSKEQLINLLCEAADNHSDVVDRIRQFADQDPAHRKLFVHGLGRDTNSEMIAAAFSQYGEIEDCKAVVDKGSGKSKGYGFVLFKNRSGARKALEEPKKKIGDRMTSCQLASIGPVVFPWAATTAAAEVLVPPAQPESELTQRKIYVSNVGAELDPQKLLSFFSKFGEIEDGPLGLDKRTGKPKGFCLFVYKKIDSAKKALEEPHKDFEGHTLHCRKAIDGPKPNKVKQNTKNTQFQRTENPSSYVAPVAAAGMPFNQAGLNPVIGQALTVLFSGQGAGLGLNNLLGTIGGAGGVVNSAMVPGGAHGFQGGGYGSQGVRNGILNPGVVGGYGNQGVYLPNQQMGQGGGPSRSQHGFGHMGGGAPYMGH